MTTPRDPVANAIKTAAATAILPRFDALTAADVKQKSPGDYVTIADRECEELLVASVAEIEPGVPVLGEEAASVRPEIRGDLISRDAVWVVDPLDGTGAFIDGSRNFAVMVARIERGDTVAAWIYQPLQDVMWSATKGQGTFRNEEPVTRSARGGSATLRGYIKTGQMDPATRAATRERWSPLGRSDAGPRSAGCAYPDLVEGRTDVILFWRTLPWDHAPGVLIAQESGCHVARLDGSPYRPAVEGSGLLAATDQTTWNQALTHLFPVDQGQIPS